MCNAASELGVYLFRGVYRLVNGAKLPHYLLHGLLLVTLQDCFSVTVGEVTFHRLGLSDVVAATHTRCLGGVEIIIVVVKPILTNCLHHCGNKAGEVSRQRKAPKT